MLSPVLLIISVLEGRLAGQGYGDENKNASDMVLVFVEVCREQDKVNGKVIEI